VPHPEGMGIACGLSTRASETGVERWSPPIDERSNADNPRLPRTLPGPRTDPADHVDDEYSRAGVHDPKILLTTSRDPSSKLLQFSKEMRLVLPNAHRINRGNYVVKELADACRANEITDLVVVHEHRGVPGPSFSRNPFSARNALLRPDSVLTSDPRSPVCFRRRAHRLALPARPDRLLYAPQRRPPARHCLSLVLDRLGTVPAPRLRRL
jgi:hypothetical protein